MTVRTLIADDEPLACKRLRQLLAAHPDIEIVEECRSGTEVVEALKTKAFDLVFLDIQMPGNTGFEVIEAVGVMHMPLTVFVTAYNSYAVQAFEVHALDYLIKPISVERLRATIAHIKEQISANSALTIQAQLSSLLQQANDAFPNKRVYPERLLVPNGQEEAFITVNDIELIEAADDYARIHIGSKTFMLRVTIRQLESSLDPTQFVRIHRSAIVNVRHVLKILREGRADGWLILTNNKRIKMSRVGWQNLMTSTSPDRQSKRQGTLKELDS